MLVRKLMIWSAPTLFVSLIRAKLRACSYDSRGKLAVRIFVRVMIDMECALLADIVAKVFLGWRTKFPRAADAFCVRRCEGPHHFAQKRPQTSASALHSVAAVGISNKPLSRDF